MPIVQLTPTNSAVLPAATKSWRSSSGADLGGTDAEAIRGADRGMDTDCRGLGVRANEFAIKWSGRFGRSRNENSPH